MMTFNHKQGLDFKGTFAINQRPEVMLDGGRTIEEITIAPPASGTALVAADFTLVITVNEDKRVEITGQKLLDRESYEGRPATTGYFTFSFADFMALAGDRQGLSSLCTTPDDRIKVALHLAGSITGTGARLFIKDSLQRPEVFRLYCLSEQVQVTATGRNTFDGFRKGLGANQIFVRRAHIYGNITHLELIQGSESVFGENGLPIAVNNAELKRNGKTAISSCFTLDPIVNGNVFRDLLDTWHKENPKLRALVTTGDGVDCYAQTEYLYNMAAIRGEVQAAA